MAESKQSFSVNFFFGRRSSHNSIRLSFDLIGNLKYSVFCWEEGKKAYSTVRNFHTHAKKNTKVFYSGHRKSAS